MLGKIPSSKMTITEFGGLWKSGPLKAQPGAVYIGRVSQLDGGIGEGSVLFIFSLPTTHVTVLSSDIGRCLVDDDFKAITTARVSKRQTVVDVADYNSGVAVSCPRKGSKLSTMLII